MDLGPLAYRGGIEARVIAHSIFDESPPKMRLAGTRHDAFDLVAVRFFWLCDYIVSGVEMDEDGSEISRSALC